MGVATAVGCHDHRKLVVRRWEGGYRVLLMEQPWNNVAISIPGADSGGAGGVHRLAQVEEEGVTIGVGAAKNRWSDEAALQSSTVDKGQLQGKQGGGGRPGQPQGSNSTGYAMTSQ